MDNETNSYVYATPAIPLQSEQFLYDKSPPPRGNPNDNPFYNCYLTCPDKNILIRANLPHEYSLDFGAAYEASFSQSLSDNTYAAARKVGNALGLQFVTKAMTAKLWQGSNDVTFSLPFIFQIETDYYKDVLEPMSQLYRLVLPKQSASFGLLESPGPSLDLQKLKALAGDTKIGDVLSKSFDAVIDGTKSIADGELPQGPDPTAALLGCIKNNCSLVIGGYQYFDSVVVTNVAQTTSVLPYYKTGTMSRVEVVVTFSTFVVPTEDDIPKLLLGSMVEPQLSDSSSVASSNPTASGSEDNADRLDTGMYGDTLSDEEYEDYLNNYGIF
jgi:hypothetical protein